MAALTLTLGVNGPSLLDIFVCDVKGGGDLSTMVAREGVFTCFTQECFSKICQCGVHSPLEKWR